MEKILSEIFYWDVSEQYAKNLQGKLAKCIAMEKVTGLNFAVTFTFQTLKTT